MNFKEPINMTRTMHYGNNYWESYSNKLKRKVRLFSNLEYENFLTLEMNPEITFFCEQPIEILVNIDGKPKKSIIDFWVKYNDGSEEMQEVKYLAELTGNDNSSLRSQKQIQAQIEWCLQNQIKHTVRTEENIQKGIFFIRNLNFMAAKVRRYIPTNIKVIKENIESVIQMNKTITVKELIDNSILTEINALSILSYFYYIGTVQLNIKDKPLDYSTEVTLCQKKT